MTVPHFRVTDQSIRIGGYAPAGRVGRVSFYQVVAPRPTPICIDFNISRTEMHATTSAKVQEARLSALQAEVDSLQAELGEHEDAEKIVKHHIKLLHRYNEAKDATQASLENPAYINFLPRE
ncbi:hypothetical protein FPV67DRAFT_1663788 [Lyophyllum atratum]|nr:hypothetical protein FPV67DRAFT_1663788 [Lyophyllum atratum]